jgi:hypothetical protein
MSTGENEQDLRKVMDMTRLLSILILLLHFYFLLLYLFCRDRLANSDHG